MLSYCASHALPELGVFVSVLEVYQSCQAFTKS